MEEIKRMVSRQGFVDVFCDRLAAGAKNGDIICRQDLFDSMEEEFEKEYCCCQFPSFDAFRQYYYRQIRSKIGR